MNTIPDNEFYPLLNKSIHAENLKAISTDYTLIEKRVFELVDSVFNNDTNDMNKYDRGEILKSLYLNRNTTRQEINDYIEEHKYLENFPEDESYYKNFVL